MSWPTVLAYYSVSLKKLLKFSTEMCSVQNVLFSFFKFQLICIIPYIYPRDSTIKYIHFNFAALSDGCLWFPWNVTHYLFCHICKKFNVLYKWLSSWLLPTSLIPQYEIFYFVFLYHPAKKIANEHKSRKHFYCYNMKVP